jgi:hypothetical protein
MIEVLLDAPPDAFDLFEYGDVGLLKSASRKRCRIAEPPAKIFLMNART